MDSLHTNSERVRFIGNLVNPSRGFGDEDDDEDSDVCENKVMVITASHLISPSHQLTISISYHGQEGGATT